MIAALSAFCVLGLLHRDAAGAPKSPGHSEDDVLTTCTSVCGKPMLAVRLADSSWGLVTGYDPTFAHALPALQQVPLPAHQRPG